MKRIIIRLASIVVIITMTMAINGCGTTKKTTRTRTITTNTYLDEQEKPLGDWITCTACNGKGHCSRCGGTGKVNGVKCTSCDNGLCAVCKGQGGYRK